MGYKPIFDFSKKEVQGETQKSYRFRAGIKLKFRLVPEVKAYLDGEYTELRVVQATSKEAKK
jgi:hypothetical protein